MLRPRDPELQALREQFVCVRCVQMGGVDLALFQFDPFLSWAVFFLNPDRTIYGRFGSASPHSKRNLSDSNPNHSVEGLEAAMRRALQLHEEYSEEPERMGELLAGKTGPPPLWRTAESTPSAQKHQRVGRVTDGTVSNCLHCHEVQRMAIDSHFMTDTPLPDRMLWVYPKADTLGLRLDRDHCARVRAVLPDSAAAAAGLLAGDQLLALGGQPLVSVADVEWVLHQFPDEGGPLDVRFTRGDQTRSVSLTLPDGWRRRGDFGWRYRVAGYAAWLWSGVSVEDHADGIRVSHLSPGWFKKTNRRARGALRVGDLIVAVDGQHGLTRSQYIAYLMREVQPGATVALSVRRGDQEVDVSFPVPSPRPEVQGH